MNGIPSEVTEAAAEWLARLAPDSPYEERQAFMAWLMRSPTHVEEFLHVSLLREQLKDAANPGWVSDVLHGIEGNVLEIPTVPPPVTPPKRPAKRRVPALAAAAALATASLAAWLGPWLDEEAPVDPASIETRIGEQRFVTLSDGSSIELNTDSRVRVSLTPLAREIELERGELLVDVAEDPARPFRVRSGAVTVEALGTRFTIYRRSEDTLVAVVEGRVSVQRSTFPAASVTESPGTPHESLELLAGQQVSVAVDAAIAPTPANLEKVIAWTEQRVVFEDESLETVLTEFNRYSPTRLVIADPALRGRRITGRYAINDANELIKVLDALDPIRVEMTPGGHRALYRDVGDRP